MSTNTDSARFDRLSEVEANDWRRILQDAPPCVFPRPRAGAPSASVAGTVQSGSVLRRQIFLPNSGRSGLPLDTVLQAAWALLNVSYSDTDDVVFGMALVDEDSDDLSEPHTALPFRFTLHPDQTIADCLETIEAQELPLLSSPGIDLDAIAGLGPAMLDATQFRNQLVVYPAMMANADVLLNRPLNVECFLNPSGVLVQAFYDSALLEDTQVRQILATFETLIQELDDVSNLGKPTGQVSAISPEDQKQLQKWCKDVPPVVEKCIHWLFQEKARETPGAEAVFSIAQNVSWTYEQLDALTDKLAHLLVSKQVSPGKIVPLMFEKSVWTVVAAIAVLKAGGAFGYIEPNQPWEDVSRLLGACESTFVLCSQEYEGLLSTHDVESVIVDEALLARLPSCGSVEDISQPADPSYIIFTSGSTGRPKGIISSHRSFCTSALAHGKAEFYSSEARCFAFSSYNFDVSVTDIFTTLAFGACICIPSDEEKLDRLAETVALMRATHITCTPTVSQFLYPEDLPTVKTVITGGEFVKNDVVNRWASAGRTYINIYGPAECNSRMSHHIFKAGTDPSIIGRPTGAVVWLTKSNDPETLVPIGAVGEILIEGNLISDGYLKDEEKTVAAFITAPKWLVSMFPDRESSRLYRTGDLAHWLPDGTLRILGRRDTQMKIHGVRLEASHVEAKLSTTLPKGSQVIVEKISLGQEAKREKLAAFVILPSESTSKNETVETSFLEPTPELCDLLAGVQNTMLASLPAWMCPNHIIPINQFPRSQAGKVNRKVLLAMVVDCSEEFLNQFTVSFSAGNSKERPAGPVEKAVASLWADVLHISSSSIGRHDTFFRLGGDSVAAMKVAAACSGRNDLLISVADIFRHPKLSDLAANISGNVAVSETIVAPFDLIGGPSALEKYTAALTSAGINSSTVEDIYPCTPMQEGMMAETMLSPDTYKLQHVLKLDPKVDVARLQSAIEQLVKSFAILRTRIILMPRIKGVTGSSSYQVVVNEHSPIQIRRTTEKLKSALSAEKKAAEVGYGQELSRFAVITAGDRYLVWTVHHAVTDGYTYSLFLNKLQDLYSGLGVFKPPTPFVNFVKHLQDQDPETSAGAWRKLLQDGTPSQWPVCNDEAHQPVVTRTITTTISHPANESGFTMSTVIRAAWALALSGLTKSSDIITGLTLAGRDIELPGVEDCAGPCLTTVPFRVVIGEETCASILDSVQQRYADVIPHQHIGFKNIRKALSGSEACDMLSLLVVQPADYRADQDLWTQDDDLSTDEELGFGFTLECLLGKSENEITVLCGFDEKILSEVEASHVLEMLSAAVNSLSLASNQDKQLADVADLDFIQQPKASKLNVGMDTVDKCLHWMVEDQVRSQPDAIMIDAWDAKLTYREAGEYITRLASFISGLGVGPEIIVPFAFEKSAWTTIAVLAVLKAGGACVALDMAHPRPRLEQLIEDVESKVILCSRKHERALQTFKGVQHAIAVDRESLDALSSDAAFRSDVKPSNLAWVVYSSGSTGKPKGTMLEHRSLATTARTNSEILGCGPGTRALSFASHTFDVTIEDNVIIPMFGGCICIPSDEDRFNDLTGVMTRMSVNWADLTPTVARMLSPTTVPTLRTLVIGGEALTQDIIDTWVPVEDFKLFITYGPSECSVQCTSSFDGLGLEARGANIGYPVNCSMFIVDSEDPNVLLPAGEAGEMLVEGPIVGRGYLKEEAKTRAAFVQDVAWAKDPSRRFYRTGDLGVLNEDGTFTFLSRMDTQIKLYGQRIELGEIEVVILKSSNLSQVCVEAFSPQSSPGRKLLAAFIQLNRESGFEKMDMTSQALEIVEMTASTREKLAQMKQYTADHLPEHMVPSLFVPVYSLPMSASGKVDRKSLRELASGFSQQQTVTYALGVNAVVTTAPQVSASLVTKVLMELWAEVLQIDLSSHSIGDEDSFLELGGDSIAAMQLVSRAKAAGLELSVRGIMKTPSLANMVLSAKVMPGAELEPKSVATVAKTSRLGLSLAIPTPTTAISKGLPTPSLAQDEFYQEFSLIPETLGRTSLLNEVLDSVLGDKRPLVNDVYPCTPLQDSLMALTAKDRTAYVLREVFDLPAGTEVARFKQAWSDVVRANDIFRTRIIHVAGHGSFSVVLDTSLEWTEVKTLDEYLALDTAEDRDMNYGTDLVRFGLVESDGDIQFVWTIHHALYDGFSYALTLEAVDQAYQGMGVPPTRPVLDLVRYLSRLPQNGVSEFWTDHLEACEATPFPPAAPGQICVADNTVTHSVKFRRPARSKFTAATVLKAAWSILMARVSDSNDVVYGLTSFGRDVPIDDVDVINGPLLTTTPVRMQVDPTATVESFLRAVHAQSIDAGPFSHAGIHNIKKFSDSCRTACEFQNLIVIQPAFSDDNAEEDSLFRDHETHTTANIISGFGLVVECGLGEGTVSLTAHHDVSVLSELRAERLLRQFARIIEQLIRLPRSGASSITVGDIDVLSSKDRQDLREWNGNCPSSVDACMHQLIKQQTLSNPKLPAIESRVLTLSYRELDDLATHQAHQLCALGAGPEKIIPICIEKSVNAIVAMLAVQKAGSAFVPLNPDDPADRLADLVAQVQAEIIIVSPSTENSFSSFNLKTVTLATDVAKWGPLNTSPLPASSVKPENLAYVLFTSGSAGRPKAVMIEHRAVCASTAGHGAFMGFGDFPRRALQFATYTFDACIAEIFTTLTHGGTICVPTEQERMNDLAGFIRDFKCDWAFFTPTFARLLKPESIPSMKTLVLGGEALTQESVETWSDKLKLMNGYGPTETCVFCVSRDVSKHHKPENIGRPVSSVGWVVDAQDHNRLVPIGCTGELLVQGPGVARGYLGQPDKTSEVFVAAPAWLRDFGYSGTEQLLYKTGDLVRQDLVDGSLLYLGRKDNQTKVNGQRLELGEIEAVLNGKDAAVEQVVVMAGKTVIDKNKQVLVAFVELVSSEQGDLLLELNDDLRVKMKELEVLARASLPRYMVPTLWIPVSQMPSMAASGKTDRKTLGLKIASLTPEQLTAYSLATHNSSDQAAPSTDMELSIVNLVAQSLGRDAASLSVNDNFLALGGDSITAIQLTGAARAAGIILTHEDVFRQPCLADMAKVAKFTSTSSAETSKDAKPFSLIPEDKRETVLSAIETTYRIPRSNISDVLPCAPLQLGLIALTVRDSQAYVLREVYRLPAKLDVERFKQAWEAVARDADILRTTFVNVQELNTFFQVVKGAGKNVIDWRSGKSVKGYMDEDKRLPFQMGTPFSRLALVDTPFTGSYFIWSIHHSTYDGWSKNLILRRVQAAYESSSPRPIAQPTPPFSRFIAHLQEADPVECETFWQGQFKGISAPAWPPLPSQQFEPLLDGEVTISLPFERPLGSRFTTSTIIKAAWALVQGCHSGSPDDVLFGIIQSGRDTPVEGITEMVGPTITTVPLRVRCHDRSSTTISQFLHMIQDQTTNMIKYEHTGLQNIQRMGKDCRDACGFASVMIIQPPDVHDEGSFLGAQKLSDEEKETLRFGMGLQVRIRRDNQLDVVGHFDHRITPEAVMRRILFQFKYAVEQVIENADEANTTTVADLNLFSTHDKDQVLAWNQPTYLNPVDLEGFLAGGLTHELFHLAATASEAASQSMAVNAWDVDFRYGDLDRITTKLAHHLQNAFNIGPEVIVPLCFEKSGWAIVAMMSVIKAGGAVVFLDPSYPMARLSEILNQIETKVILCSLAQVSLWRSSGMSVQVVDNVSIAALPDASPELPVTKATMSTALYVIFTSGSTGTPKGCVIEHKSFLYSCQAQARMSKLRPESRVLQGAPYSFDVSVMEMITTLLHGACVCVPNERAKNRSMVDVINDFHINWTFLTPSVVKFIEPSDVPTLETLILGGEALTKQNIEVWASKLRLVNGYGPTECAISAAVNNNLTTETDPANIGKAIGGICWIVDAENHDRLAPVGTVGELVIEGPILGRGYLKNPEKTAEAFVSDPAWSLELDGKSRRLYKSGDLAYYDADGCIMFCGRKDAQVKVRGQRMELGEIESHLSQNPEIQHAAVLYPASGPCKGQLVGLISLKKLGAETNRDGVVELVNTGEAEKAMTALAITSDATVQLSTLVPGYMIPNLWITVKSFPLLPSEKLNRKCLTQWLNTMPEELHKRVCGISTGSTEGSADSPQTLQLVGPSTDAERSIHQVWCEVLNLQTDEVGVTQDFVTLGGDSILAMAMASKLRKAGFQVSVGDLLMTRTITRLAARIGHTAKKTSDKAVRPLAHRLLSFAGELTDLDNDNDTGYESDNSVATTTATSVTLASSDRIKETQSRPHQPQPSELFDLTPMQQYYAHLALGDDELSRQTDARFNHSFCIRLKRPINPAVLSAAYSKLISRHMMLRVRLQRCDKDTAACGFRQFVSPDVKESFRLREWSNVASVDDVKDRLEDSRITLDLENGPISSLDLVTTADGQSSLYLVAHHIVVDLVSWNSLLRDFDDLLSKASFAAEEPGPFPLWAQQQRDYARTHLDPKTALPAPIPTADFGFWGMADAQGKPLPNVSRDSIHHRIRIPELATTLLMRESHAKFDAEPMDILVAALTRSFFLVYGQVRSSPPSIFRFGHGREDIEGLPDVSSTVGWFSTLSPIHVPVGLGNDCSATGVLSRTVDLRQRTPNNGWAYFASRYHHPDGATVFAGHENMEVAVNYLGVMERQERSGGDSALFDLSHIVDGGLGAHGQEVKCMSLFGITAEVRSGCLEVNLEWNRRIKGQGQIRSWWREFEACLKELASTGSPYIRSPSGEEQRGMLPGARRESSSRATRRMRSMSRQRSTN